MSVIIHAMGDRVLAVGDRTWPAEIDSQSVDHGDVLGEDSTHRWFHIRRARVWFESGWGVSIAWGSGNYGTNHENWSERLNEEPTTVEVGVISEAGLLGSRVAGYMEAEVVNELLDEVSRWPTLVIMTLPAHLEKRFD
jgi:hypothetical protein